MPLFLLLLFAVCWVQAQDKRAPSWEEFHQALGSLNAGCPINDGGFRQLPECEMECTSPIIVDLGGDYPRLGGPESAIFFDLLGTGEPLYLQWLQPRGNDAFLVMDLNRNGWVDNGTEMFGKGTRLILEDGRPAGSGYVGLQQWDDPRLGGNDDGFLNKEDLFFEDISLWLDFDADGQTDQGELQPLAQHGIFELETIPDLERIRDKHGNWLRYWAWSFAYGETHGNPIRITMVDVIFRLRNPGL